MIGFTDPFEHTWTDGPFVPPIGGTVRASRYRSSYRYRDVFRMLIIALMGQKSWLYFLES